LPSAALAPIVDALRRQGPQGLRAFFSALLSVQEPERLAIVAMAAAQARAQGTSDAAWDWVGRLARHYPQDIGILSPLYLNVVLLEPGQGLFLPAGELHAYLDGMGVEIMANSDNVLRGGLTPKHVDVPELLRLLTFTAAPAEILTPRPCPDGALVFLTPAAEFELALLRVEPDRRRDVSGDHGIEILLTLEGRARVVCGQTTLDLVRGEAVLVPSAASAYRIEGAAAIARARVPRGQ
jgi:mannose-6-phosphate isomerase